MPLAFELPPLESGRSWRRWIDTYRDAPDDVAPWDAAPLVQDGGYVVPTRSLVTLFADRTQCVIPSWPAWPS